MTRGKIIQGDGSRRMENEFFFALVEDGTLGNGLFLTGVALHCFLVSLPLYLLFFGIFTFLASSTFSHPSENSMCWGLTIPQCYERSWIGGVVSWAAVLYVVLDFTFLPVFHPTFLLSPSPSPSPSSSPPCPPSPLLSYYV